MRIVGGAHGRVSPERLAELLAAALPQEELTADELAATLFDDPDGTVLASGTDGAVGVARRGDIGFVTVLVVDPPAQGRGIGRSLLADAERWLRDRGARRVLTGAAAPRYLWPGVDVEAHAGAVRFFEACGYVEAGRARNHRCSTSFRAPPPAGVTVRRVVEGSPDAAAVVSLASSRFPQWVDEVTRALPRGCIHGAFEAGRAGALGFGCHSVNRAGWIGPMATDPEAQGRGIGAALLGAVCRDLTLAELDEAEIAWVGPDAFYERTAGSTVSRRFVLLARELG